MNVASLLGRASDPPASPGGAPLLGTAGAERPFPALLADALDGGGESGLLPSDALLAGAATPALAIPAAPAAAALPLPEPEKPLADAADPDADDRRTLSALAALPTPLFTTTPLPPPLIDAPLAQTPAGDSAWPSPSLTQPQATPGVSLTAEARAGATAAAPAITAAALPLAAAAAAAATAAAGSPGQGLLEPMANFRPVADAPASVAAPLDPRAATSAAATAALGAAATGLTAQVVPARAPLTGAATARLGTASTADAEAGENGQSTAATSAKSALGLASAAAALPALHPEPAVTASPLPAPESPPGGPKAPGGGELPAAAGNGEAAPVAERAPEAKRPERAPLRDAAAEPRDLSALEGGRAGAASRLEAAEAMAPAPKATALRIQELPERALRIASELRADGARQYRAELQLDPPGLGRLRIEIEMKVQEAGEAERSLTRITVETAAAHEQLQAELPRLRALLAEQGLGEAQVELQLRQEQGQGAEEQQAQRGPRQGGEGDEHERSGRRLEWRSTHDGLIDLRA